MKVLGDITLAISLLLFFDVSDIVQTFVWVELWHGNDQNMFCCENLTSYQVDTGEILQSLRGIVLLGVPKGESKRNERKRV